MGAETLLALALVVLAGCFLGGVFFIARALRPDPVIDAEYEPKAPKEVPLGLLERLAEQERKLDSLFALRAEWATYQEIVDDALETAEVKRRRAAASASRRGPGPSEADVAAAVAKATEAGLIPNNAPQNLSHITDRAELRRQAKAAGKI
jgi:hypothetical protein